MELAVGILSTVIIGVISWFAIDLITQTRNKVNETDKTIKVISKEVQEIKENLVEVKTDIRYLKEDRGNLLKFNSDEKKGRFVK